MSKLDYILSRIDEGARVRVATDYFGQHVIEVPHRWLPISQRQSLRPAEMDEVRRALLARRSRRTRSQSSGNGVLSRA